MNPEPNQPWPGVKRKIEGQKPQILWPISCQKIEWEIINTDHVHLLEGLKGCIERKLENMGDTIYSYGVERFGVKVKIQRTEKEFSVQPKSRAGNRKTCKGKKTAEKTVEEGHRGRRERTQGTTDRSKAAPSNA